MSYAGDLTPAATWELLQGDASAILVDCRTDAEWNYVGVPDLVRLGKQLVLAQWQTFPDGELNSRFVADLRRAGVTDGVPVAFICRSGHRSIGAAEAATRAGIGPAYNVLDGFEGPLGEDGHRGVAGWRAVGLPWRQF
ncbi:rhodanese-like domain-containing protein [Tsukamurella soli]|uniref:Rhodanese-like domain-containing protein n=1 Tax=Tsukamurella soli TaxID=644556 RepID=A0ABP8K1I2_9ACTN